MIKKEYMTPAVEVVKMNCTPLLTGSITLIDGNSGIELGDDADVPTSADAPTFLDDDLNLFGE